MTLQEFSNEFDLLYNNIMSNSAPGLDEYEKSVFLTKAQEEIVKNYFNPMGNKYNEGFDGSLKRQIDFSSLIRGIHINESTTGFLLDAKENAVICYLPKEVMIILNESVSANKGSELSSIKLVTPLSFEEYTRLKSKPYKYPSKNIVWRLIDTPITHSGGNSLIGVVLILESGYTFASYNLRYIARPTPIILSTISTGIDGVTDATNCTLNPNIHREILTRAVELAKVAFEGNVQTLVQTNRSE